MKIESNGKKNVSNKSNFEAAEIPESQNNENTFRAVTFENIPSGHQSEISEEEVAGPPTLMSELF